MDPFLFIIFVAALQGRTVRSRRRRGRRRELGSIFWNISLPMMRPVIAVAVILRGIDITTMFTNVYIMTCGTPAARHRETMSASSTAGLPHLQFRLCLRGLVILVLTAIVAQLVVPKRSFPPGKA